MIRPGNFIKIFIDGTGHKVQELEYRNVVLQDESSSCHNKRAVQDRVLSTLTEKYKIRKGINEPRCGNTNANPGYRV